MAEHDEKAEGIQNEIDEIKGDVKTRVLEIKNISDSLISLIEKEDFKEADLDNAFDTTDLIQEHSQEITALLFNLRDVAKL
jgi:hypothetical protein